MIAIPETYGGRADGATDSSAAINEAVAAVNAGGGGAVVLTPGVYVARGINLLSGVTLYCATPFPAFTTLPSAATTTAAAVLKCPDDGLGGVVVSVNGTAAAPVVYSGIENVILMGPGGDGGNLPASGALNSGIKIGPNAQWTTLNRVTAQFFGDQGMILGGKSVTGTFLRSVYNLRRQPRARISGQGEIYGSDHMIDRCEFTGIIAAELATLDPTLLFNRSLLVQSANSFYSAIIAECGDAGLTVMAKVNPAPLADGSDWPQCCLNNKFERVRADHNWGNGFEILNSNGAYVYDATLSNCWSDGNGQDKTSLRKSLVTGANATTSDAGFFVQGVRNRLLGCSHTSYELSPPNVNYGAVLQSKIGPSDAQVLVDDFSTAGEGLSYLVAPTVTLSSTQ